MVLVGEPLIMLFALARQHLWANVLKGGDLFDGLNRLLKCFTTVEARVQQLPLHVEMRLVFRLSVIEGEKKSKRQLGSLM